MEYGRETPNKLMEMLTVLAVCGRHQVMRPKVKDKSPHAQAPPPAS